MGQRKGKWQWESWQWPRQRQRPCRRSDDSSRRLDGSLHRHRPRSRMSNEDNMYRRIAPDVKLGQRVKIFAFTNLYGCEIGDDSKIGAFVKIQKGARIGRRAKISSHTFICEGVTIEDEVFIGHNVTFINERFPRATNSDGSLQTEANWACVPTVVKRGASIGSGA